MRPSRPTTSAVALAAATLLGSGPGGPPPAVPAEVRADLIITNVTVVDTEDGSLARHMSVVVDDGRITEVAKAASLRPARATTVVNGGGKYLVPGYLDMHTHSAFDAAAPTAYSDLLLAHGVTGIREMVGNPARIALADEINAARADGDLAAPEVLQVGGPAIAGIVTADQGIAAVEQAKAMGADFAKVVFAGPAAVQAVLAEAESQGIAVAGHLPPGINAVDAARRGWDSVEHLGASPGPVQLACSSDQDAIRASLVRGEGARPPIPLPPTYTASPFLYSVGDAPFLQRMMDTFDPRLCAQVVDAILAERTWQVPTLIRLRTMLRSDDPTMPRGPGLRYVSADTRATWNRLADEFARLEPRSARDTFHDLLGSYTSFMRLLHDRGGAATTMTGTDAGAIWTVPGVSLHQEFHELAAVGLSPLEVLQATTRNGARHLGREDTMGSVSVGKNADLVMLDANPLRSVTNLSRISGVVNAGHFLSERRLTALKDAVARDAAEGRGGIGDHDH